jgi:hypothetical protein
MEGTVEGGSELIKGGPRKGVQPQVQGRACGCACAIWYSGKV